MIPIGRPFLDYALSASADAGLTEVCLVVSPGPSAMRDYYERVETRRIRISFAVQEKPIGVANAVLAAREIVGNENFIVVNADNYYPAPVVRQLAACVAPALPAFSRDGLLRDGQIAAERIAAYALLDIAPDGTLRRIVEKPNAEQVASMPNAPVSMNCWLFTPEIFAACQQVRPSARGELELPDAVQLGIDRMGMRFHTFLVDSPVLDLSNRGDIPEVARRLRGVSIAL
jgi:dTDP-glucose pyrophosphorylase